MVIAKSQNTYTGYLDGYLKKNLDICKTAIKDDWDFIFCVDGYEGSGKSVFAQQIGFYCDPTLCLDRVVFTPKDFREAIIKAKKYQCIIYDEAYGGMSSRASLSKLNQSLMKMLAEIRQKNLFVIIVLPCYFELDRYAAVWRSRALFHVYTGKGFKRGFFSFFGQDKKKLLYMFGKKFYNYKKTKPDFIGSFTKGMPLDEKEYRAKKLKALSENYSAKEEESISLKRLREQRDKLIVEYKTISGLKDREIAELLDLSRVTITEARKRAGSLEK